MININQFDVSTLPENAQIELYDFYLFLKQCYAKIGIIPSNHKTSKIDTIFHRICFQKLATCDGRKKGNFVAVFDGCFFSDVFQV